MSKHARLVLAVLLAAVGVAAASSPAGAATIFVTVGITSPAQGATVFGPITVTGTASAKFSVNTVGVAIDSGVFHAATGTNKWSFAVNTDSLTNGAHTITAQASDNRGHLARTSVGVTVNNTPPAISIASPTNGALLSGTFTVSGTASSPAAGVASVQLSVDSGPWTSAVGTTSWSASINSNAFADGSHTISAKATDSVGHATTASVSVTFSNSPPAVSITSPAAGATVSGTLSVTGTASSLAGITAVQVQVDANGWTTATGTTSWSASINTTTLTNAAHTIYARATDSLGRSTTTSVAVTVNNLIATQSTPWYGVDSTGGVNTVNQTMGWTTDTDPNSKLPTGTITFSVNSSIKPNDANPNDTCTQDPVTGFWSCVHTITSADYQYITQLGWSIHYAFHLQVEYPSTSTFIISYSGDANFAPSSAQAANT